MESSPGEFPPISRFLDSTTPTTPTNHHHTDMDIEDNNSIYTSSILPPQRFSTLQMASIIEVEPSSDPLGFTANFANTANTHRFQKRKLPPTEAQQLAKATRTTDIDNNTTSREAILKARDLIVYAYSKTPRNQQSKLLDLLEIFREYTESGNITKASNIIATQIANLEGATRQIETKTRNLNSISNSTSTSQTGQTSQTSQTHQTNQNSTFATIAKSANLHNSNSKLQE